MPETLDDPGLDRCRVHARRGEGLPRVFQEMELHGLNPPDWGEEANGLLSGFPEYSRSG